MVDAGFDDFDGRHPQRSAGGQGQRNAGGRDTGRLVRLAGAVASLALVAGLGIWGYRLAVRDVRGVPVIQALDGPMRVAPDDPGGEIADHQGLAVNDVAAAGIAAPLPDRLILAPRPVDLTDEDTAGLAGPVLPGAELVSAPSAPASGTADPVLAAAPPTESASPTEVAVDAALAEALGLAPEAVEAAEAVAPAEKASEPVQATAVAAPTEVDPATIPAGTRLVQFGAFDTEDQARAEWLRLAGAFGDLMSGKGMVLQPADSGGRTFWRLRAHGFEDEDDARRFCVAFVTQGATCIPVPQR
jgi:hypothetical protein